MKTHQTIPGSQSGSATLATLAILALTSMIVGSALMEAMSRYRTSHHSSCWVQAAPAAEAGVELALMSANNNSWVANGWSAAPGAPGTGAVTQSFPLSSGVSATGPISVDVSVEKITVSGEEWLRIRSTGRADISGGAIAGVDAQDVMLRKVSLRQDRTTNSSVGTTPRATRTIEVLARPKELFPFKYSFVARELFNFQAGSHTDSYDSRSPAKSDFSRFSTHGVYSASMRQEQGSAATLDTMHAWDLQAAHVYGDVLSPNGDVVNDSAVHGTVRSGFTFEFPEELPPTWTTVTQNHGVVTNVSKTFSGGTKASPTRHKFTSIELTSNSKNIIVTNPEGQTESWVEIWVTGDVNIAAASKTGIKLAPGVHATFHIGGKVDIAGGGSSYGLFNESERASNLIIHAYGGSSATIQDFILRKTDFWGVISAPWYKINFGLSFREAYGSFVAHQFVVDHGAKLHYDEALEVLSVGPGKGYQVMSWVEAVR